MVGAHLLYSLARDGLVPSGFGSVSSSVSTPWVATICCGSISAIAAGVLSTWFLSQAAGVGGIGAGVAGAAAVVARRYHPDATHILERSKDSSLAELQQFSSSVNSCESPRYSITYSPTHVSTGDSDVEQTDLSLEWISDGEPRELSVEWAGGGRCISKLVIPQTPPTHASWRTSRFLISTFTANSLAGAAVTRISGYLDVSWTWPGAVLCACGCLVCAVGIWLQPRHPPPPFGYHSPCMPLLPLAALLANAMLLIHLPLVALSTASIICVFALVLWLIYGRRNSFEAVISRALLPRRNFSHSSCHQV